ncbi:MAG: DUF692 family protein [Alphaproteobacteria bacterium]|nr:DUF692 family protein [Alphaproteobacteria bacterium]
MAASSRLRARVARRPRQVEAPADQPARKSAVACFEIISENFLDPPRAPRQRLARVRSRYPVVLHGVGLNLLGTAPLDAAYLNALCRLADDVDAPFVTDHLCCGTSGSSSIVARPQRRARLLDRPLRRPMIALNRKRYRRSRRRCSCRGRCARSTSAWPCRTTCRGRC